MRGAFAGSLAVHLALLSLVLIVRPPRVISLPGGAPVRVSLVDASALPSPPSLKPTPPPVAPPPDEQGVRLPDMKKPRLAKPAPERPKTPPKPVTKAAPPTASPRPATALGATTLTPARVGSTGLVGSMGVDAADFPFSYYLSLVRDRIAGNWQPPSGLGSGEIAQAVVYFKIARSGAVTDVRLETPSTADFFDRAALRAVVLSNPMPPLPAGFPGGDLGVHFGFEWEAP